MIKQTFINLPVENLESSNQFFTKLGLVNEPAYSNDKAACFKINDNSFLMLLDKPFFETFINNEIPDTSRSTEVITALSVDNKNQVDDLVKTALANGGSEYNEPYSIENMYGWSFKDPDGHSWEVIHIEEA